MQDLCQNFDKIRLNYGTFFWKTDHTGKKILKVGKNFPIVEH